MTPEDQAGCKWIAAQHPAAVFAILNTATQLPLIRWPQKDEATRFIDLAGGANAVRAAIAKALADGDLQWSLQLVDRLLNAEEDVAGNSRLKAEILKDRAVDQINCPTRHYYIQCAKELEQTSKGT